MASCVLCGEEILDLSRSAVAKQVIGWDLHRKGGGQNALHMREETGALAHAVCVMAKRRPGSGSLIDQLTLG